MFLGNLWECKSGLFRLFDLQFVMQQILFRPPPDRPMANVYINSFGHTGVCLIIVTQLLFVSDVPDGFILFWIQYYTTSDILFAIPTTQMALEPDLFKYICVLTSESNMNKYCVMIGYWLRHHPFNSAPHPQEVSPVVEGQPICVS